MCIKSCNTKSEVTLSLIWSRWWSALSRFVQDTKLGGSSRTCEGGTAIQRDWDSGVGLCAVWAGGMGSPVLGWQTPAAMLAGLRTRSEGKALGADGQRAEQGPGLCLGSSEQFGLGRAWHRGRWGDAPVQHLSGLTQDTASHLGPHTGGMSRGSG